MANYVAEYLQRHTNRSEYNFVKLRLVVFFQANKTVVYVHDVWNSYILNKLDTNVRHLQLIAIRLLNCKLKFTARNFFDLDWNFCHIVSMQNL